VSTDYGNTSPSGPPMNPMTIRINPPMNPTAEEITSMGCLITGHVWAWLSRGGQECVLCGRRR
jgi:hypothetical protein